MTKELRVEHDVVVRQMINETRKVSRLQSAIWRFREKLATTVDAFMHGNESVAKCPCLEADSMRESLSADVVATSLSLFYSIELANASLLDGSNRNSAGSL